MNRFAVGGEPMVLPRSPSFSARRGISRSSAPAGQSPALPETANAQNQRLHPIACKAREEAV
jgi:hypothetical protein